MGRGRVRWWSPGVVALSLLGCESAPTPPAGDAAPEVVAADVAEIPDLPDLPDAPGGPDARADDDVAPVGPDDPITGAPPNRWTFVPIEGARCIDDSPTGVGVNPSPNAEGLVIFLMGGGACFNPETCGGVSNAAGFDEVDLRLQASVFTGAGPFARSDPRNPFRAWHYVFFGYCTGDVHAGDNPEGAMVGGIRRVFTGYRNVRNALRRLVPTFRGVRRVLVTGVSAGGFGASFNYDQVAEAFGPSVEVSLFSDSGPPLGDDVMAPCLQSQWRRLWNLDATLPRDCVECRAQADGGGISRLAEYLARKYPTRRLGFAASTGDDTIRYFFSWGRSERDCARGRLSEDQLRAGLLGLRRRFGPTNLRSYLVPSTQHVFSIDWHSPRVDGIALSTWVGALGTGEGTVTDLGP